MLKAFKASDLPPKVATLAVVDFAEHFESLQVLDVGEMGIRI